MIGIQYNKTSVAGVITWTLQHLTTMLAVYRAPMGLLYRTVTCCPFLLQKIPWFHPVSPSLTHRRFTAQVAPVSCYSSLHRATTTGKKRRAELIEQNRCWRERRCSITTEEDNNLSLFSKQEEVGGDVVQ